MVKVIEYHYCNEIKNCGMCDYWRELHLGRGHKKPNICIHTDVSKPYLSDPNTGEISQKAPQITNFPDIPDFCPLPDKKAGE